MLNPDDAKIQSVTPGTVFEHYQHFYAMDSLVLTTSVNETLQSRNSDVKVYPNPFSSEITIQLQNSNPSSLSIKNTLGQTVFTEKSAIKLNLEFLPKGIYFLDINSGEGRMVRKIVKQ